MSRDENEEQSRGVQELLLALKAEDNERAAAWQSLQRKILRSNG